MSALPTQPYRDAHEATEETLIRIRGLARALYDLATSRTDLKANDPDNDALFALMAVIEEKAVAAQAQHDAEWIAVGGRA